MNTTLKRARKAKGRHRRSRWWLATVTGVTLALTHVPTALAETTTSAAKAEDGWLNWLLLVVFAGLCCGVAFKNPKRTHQS